MSLPGRSSGRLLRRSTGRPRPRPPRPDRGGEAGMTTAEYAVGTVAACGFAALLWSILHSPAVVSAVTGLLLRALHLVGG